MYFYSVLKAHQNISFQASQSSVGPKPKISKRNQYWPTASITYTAHVFLHVAGFEHLLLQGCVAVIRNQPAAQLATHYHCETILESEREL